jgi:Fe-S-cluster-containing hydrogenase component 2
MHPTEKHILICDLCNGDPQCVKVCQQGSWNVLRVVEKEDHPYELYARKPEEITKDLAAKIYGEIGDQYL